MIGQGAAAHVVSIYASEGRVFDGYTLVGFIAMISCTVGTNLVPKIGAMDPIGARFLLGAFGWK